MKRNEAVFSNAHASKEATALQIPRIAAPSPLISIVQHPNIATDEGMEVLPVRVKENIPDPEPKAPEKGWQIRVSYPFIHPDAKSSVTKAIESGKISSATTVVEEFEAELRKYFDLPFAKACSSGYSALLLALKLARVNSGDYVLIPAFTMAAVVNAVVAVGAKPIFVDCEQDSFNPSVEQYERRLKPNTAALIVTHTYGVPADCFGLQKFCKTNGLIFIEDIAEAIGTEYHGKLVGTFGDFVCASLYANKTITAGDGGFVLGKCKSEEEAEQLMHRANSYANHGFSKDYHFLHFEFSGNYKMSGLQAAFATPAVSHISVVMEDRLRIANIYRKELSSISGLKLMPSNPYGKDAPWMFGVMVASKKLRTAVRQKLANDGIETRDFFFPLHLQPMMFRLSNDYASSVEELPNAELLGATGFYLPTFYDMKQESIKYVAECLTKALQNTETLG